MSKIKLRKNKNGFLLGEDWYKLIAACKTLGNAVNENTSDYDTDGNGNCYMAVEIMCTKEDLQKALKIVNAYFGG